MSDFEAKVDAGELERKLERIRSRAGVEAKRAELDGARAQVDALKAEVPRKSGAMADTFRTEAIDGGTGAISRHPGAAKVDRGGTVRAQGRALAIPFSSAGLARVHAQDLGGLVVVSRGGNSLLADVSAGGFDPKYTLIDQVTIRGDGYVKRAREAAQKPIEQAAFAAAKRTVT